MSNFAAGVLAALCLKQGGTMPYVAGVGCRLVSSLCQHGIALSLPLLWSLFLEKNSSEIWWNPKCATFFFTTNEYQ